MTAFFKNAVAFAIFYLVIGTTSTSTIIETFSNCSFVKEFQCKDGSCIRRENLCDGTPQCKDQSDEVDCEECPKTDWFRCSDKACISVHFKCDGNHNCPDGSDEIFCPNTEQCVNDFSCDFGLCIPSDLVCDGSPDCNDKSDELNCKNNTDHPCAGFTCKNGHCIVDIFKCDEEDDCGDNSDEENCNVPVNSDCNLNNGLYSCKDNSSCIHAEKVCDSNFDCADKSDEGGTCKKINCLHANCTHGCINTPDGPFCACPWGYGRINDTSCEDMDECHLLHGHCSQHCKNLPGSYLCYCDEGYRLLKDGRTCVTIDGEAVLVFSTSNEIRAYNIKSRKYFEVINNTKMAIGVVYDGEHVYWTEAKLGSEAISRSYLNGTNKEVIVNTGLDMPEDMAVDFFTGNLYFVDSELKHIGVCSNDGLHCTVLINKNMDKPRAIVLNPYQGQMYWTDWGSRPEIARANMDGSNDVTIISSHIKWPNGLTLDYHNDRLYWVDGKSEWIESVKLDGTHRQKILPKLIKHPYWVAVFEDKLYWSDWKTKSLHSCNKFTGKDETTLLSSKEKIFGIRVFHPSMVKKKNHACESNPCSHLCLLRGNYSYTCACPEGKELSSNRSSCIGHEKDMFLMIASGSNLLMLHHQSLGRHDIVKNKFDKMDIDEIVYDSLKNRVIVYDLLSSTIYSIGKFDEKYPEITMLANIDIGRIEGMDIDYLTNTLYWCDPLKGTLEVMSLSTLQRAVLINDLNGGAIIDLALVPEHGLMFVALRTQEYKIHINRIGMDGKGTPYHIIEHGIKGPLVKMHYDPESYQVYIADMGGEKIESVHIEGTRRQGFREHLNPASITTLGKDVFWTSPHSKKLYWSRKGYEDRTIKSNKLDIITDSVNVVHVAAVEYRKNTVGGKKHICVQKNPCSHLCVQSQSQTMLHASDTLTSAYTCLCPTNMVISSDLKKCMQEVECKSDHFKCKKSNMCIDKSRMCDRKLDCPNGEDEDGCAGHTNACRKGQFQCTDGTCIAHKNRCDKHDDCSDKSDEMFCENYDPHKQCKTGEYECKSGLCLNPDLLCDGDKNCPDHDDEAYCEHVHCKDDQFQCHYGNCISKSWECDKELDCMDGSDEHNNCSYNLPCDPGMYHCRSGGCIDHLLICNNFDDCTDGSDEVNCFHLHIEKETKCADDEFFCNSKLKPCLPLAAKCNGTVECPNESDELDCNDEKTKCDHHEWKCHTGDKCIPELWKCDNMNDCSDGSDEIEENCKDKVIKNPFEYSSTIQMNCNDGYNCTSMGQCIDYKDLCNGFKNCYDGSDEEGACETSCKGNLCKGPCIKSPRGGICTCTDGQILASDGYSCNPPLPPCLTNPSPCNHICTDTNDSYFCSCFEGYSLRADRKSCKANGEKMSIFYEAEEELRRMSIYNMSVKVIHKENSPQLTGLDVYSAKQTVFFSIEDLNEIHSVNYATYQETIIYNILNPTLLSVDWITGNLYIVTNHTSISVCHIEQQKCSKLKTFKSGKINALAVDPINRIMFCSLTSWLPMKYASSEIYKMNLDSTHDELFVKNKLSLCKGLAVDYEKKLLYISDKMDNKIESINYEGSHRQLVFPDDVYIQRPVNLDIFEDEIYYMVGNTRKMTKCSIAGIHKCASFSVDAYGVEHFKIGQSNKQKSVMNECANANCTYICVLAPNGAKCLCSNGESITEGLMCTNNETQNIPEFEIINAGNSDSIKASKVGGNKGLVAVSIIFTLAFMVCGIYIVYKYQRKIFTKTTNPDIPVHFQNPTYVSDTPNFTIGLGSITSKFPSLLRLNQNEYVNPLNSKMIPNAWSTSATNTKSMKKSTGNQLEVPKLLADSDSDVESDRDLHDGDKTRLMP